MIIEEITLVVLSGILTILNWWILCKGDNNLQALCKRIDELEERLDESVE